MKLIICNFAFIILLIVNAILIVQAENELKLKFVNVVFRHADRTPDKEELLPVDLEANEDFYPIGMGGLTNEGKLREYNLGKILRAKYDDFLGDVYLPQSVYARSTDYARTKMCLQLVLAGLYPPNPLQKWNKELNWQPIPGSFEVLEKDWLMYPELCPEFLKLQNELQNLKEIRLESKKYEGLIKNIQEWTGKDITNIYDLYTMYHYLIAKSFMNLTLPIWTKSLFPYGELYEAAKFQYELFSYTNELRKLNGGKLLYAMIEDMKKIISSTGAKNRKIALYSGHETNIANFMNALGIFKPHVPAYSSAVIGELYELNSEYYVKILYYRGVPSTFVAQQIPGCPVLCPFNKFVHLLKDVTPSSSELICKREN